MRFFLTLPCLLLALSLDNALGAPAGNSIRAKQPSGMSRVNNAFYKTRNFASRHKGKLAAGAVAAGAAYVELGGKHHKYLSSFQGPALEDGSQNPQEQHRAMRRALKPARQIRDATHKAVGKATEGTKNVFRRKAAERGRNWQRWN